MTWLDDARFLARDAASRLTETAEEFRRDHTIHESAPSTQTRTEVGEAMQYWNAQAQQALSTFERYAPHQIAEHVRMGVATGMLVPGAIAGTGATVIDAGRNLARGRVRDAARTVVATLANPFIEVAAGPLEGAAYAIRTSIGDQQRNTYRETQAIVGYGLNVLAAVGVVRGARGIAAGRVGQAVISGAERGAQALGDAMNTAADHMGPRHAYATANVPGGRSPTAPTTTPSTPDLAGPTVAMMQRPPTGEPAPDTRSSSAPPSVGRPIPEAGISSFAYRLQDLMSSAYYSAKGFNLNWQQSVASFLEPFNGRFNLRGGMNGNPNVPFMIEEIPSTSETAGGVRVTVGQQTQVVNCNPATTTIEMLLSRFH